MIPHCGHALIVDEPRWCGSTATHRLYRICLLCGQVYDRTKFLAELQERIRARNRVGPLPVDVVADLEDEDLWLG